MLAVLVTVGAVLPVPYVALGPGPTFNTVGTIDGRDVITITGREPNERKGHLNLTTVGVVDGINIFEALSGWLDSDVSVVPRETVYPPDKTEEEQDKQNLADFVQSQDSATIAALSYLKYPKKVVVVDVPKGSPSAKVLQPGDAIESINNQPIANDDELLAALTAIPPDTKITVGYTRVGKAGTGTVETAKASGRDGSVLGVTISYEPKAPFDVEISVADVGGPSAGLMFSLGIIDLVGPEDLTGGEFIAGTGTIDAAGKVGPIGGIRLKMIGAKTAGATVFLVPADNCAEARQDPPAGLSLARVATLEDAIAALADVRAGKTPAGC